MLSPNQREYSIQQRETKHPTRKDSTDKKNMMGVAIFYA